MSIPKFWRRLYALAAVAYIALGFVFAGVAYAQMERIGPSFYDRPGHEGPDRKRRRDRTEVLRLPAVCDTCRGRSRPTA